MVKHSHPSCSWTIWAPGSGYNSGACVHGQCGGGNWPWSPYNHSLPQTCTESWSLVNVYTWHWTENSYYNEMFLCSFLQANWSPAEFPRPKKFSVAGCPFSPCGRRLLKYNNVCVRIIEYLKVVTWRMLLHCTMHHRVRGSRIMLWAARAISTLVN